MARAGSRHRRASRASTSPCSASIRRPASGCSRRRTRAPSGGGSSVASITFNDGASATLSNGLSAPADRFANWTPDVESVGVRKATLGDGVTYEWRFRSDYIASLEIPHIPAPSLDVAIRLKLHLLGGGTCTVATGDTSSRTYTARLAPGTEPEITFSDRKRLRYTFRCVLKNTSAAAMLCTYPLG